MNSADNLFNEGDTESLHIMAKENGIEEDYVEMYLQGDIPELCDPLTAAIRKLEVECRELKPKEIMLDWIEYIKGQCMESEEVALAVKKKRKIHKRLYWSITIVVVQKSARHRQRYHKGSRHICR